MSEMLYGNKLTTKRYKEAHKELRDAQRKDHAARLEMERLLEEFVPKSIYLTNYPG